MTGYQTYWRKSPKHKWIKSLMTQYEERMEYDINYLLGYLATQGNFDGQAAYKKVEIVSGIRTGDLVDRNEKMNEIRTVLPL